MLHLTTLGSSCIKDDGGIELSLDAQRPKRLALLAYLAAARPFGPHRRDMLLTVFWPELDDARARAALRQSLHGIRRAVRHGRDSVTWARVGGAFAFVVGLRRMGIRDSRRCWAARAPCSICIAAIFSSACTCLRRRRSSDGWRASGRACERWRRAVRGRSLTTPLRTASGDVLRSVRVALGLSGLDERALRTRDASAR